ncbi:MAG: hemolysin family protein [Fimbriimonas sp.]
MKPAKRAKLDPRNTSDRSVIALVTAGLVSFSLLGNGLPGVAQVSAVPLENPLGEYSPIFAVFGFILLNAAFKASEAALEILRPGHLRAVRDASPTAGARLQILFDDQLRSRAACTLGSHFCNFALIFLAFLPAPMLAQNLTKSGGLTPGYGPLLLAALLIAIPVLLVNLVAGELIPRSLALLHPHRVLLRLYRFVRLSTVLLAVPAKVVAIFAGLITARFGGKASFDSSNLAEEEIKTLVETAEESGEIESDERELLHSVFDFNDTVAREIMTPRVDLDALPLKSTVTEVLDLIHRTGHSRIPLYEETDDQIVGIVHAKDLLVAVLNKNEEVNLRTLMRPAFFIPESKDLHELLTEMKSHRTQLAIVQDEFGGTAGIVTIEDIVEELVGDIVDEYDHEEPAVVATERGHVIDGKTHLDDVNDEIGTTLESEEFDTLGGYVFGLFGRQPQAEEWIEEEGMRFTVTKTDGRRIQKVRIERVSSELSTATS